LIGRLSANDATVLLTGESGTGKELVARAIHFNSARWRAPFVPVNCSAIPQGLLESELFGHERGSFTGATERRAGKFELAGSGTLFLDEVADLPLELQPKLLRALQEREFTRVGGADTLKFQARVIAATNQNLESAVQARRFREDLYFRLKVIPILMPPLRERREDIEELADYFVAKAAKTMGAKVTTISPEARKALTAQDWPGNVRELENCMLRAAILAPGNVIRPEDLELGRAGRTPAASSDGASLDEILDRQVRGFVDSVGDDNAQDLLGKLLPKIERPLIEAALERFGGNQIKAARMLGLNRNTLRKKINDYKIVIKKGAIQ